MTEALRRAGRIDATLLERFRAAGVRVEATDDNTVSLRNVPAHPDRFSKRRTNLLMQRPRSGLPFIVCVDEDLEYTGADEQVVRLFAGAQRQRGWRILRLPLRSSDGAQDAVERALAILGFDGQEPAADPRFFTVVEQPLLGILATGEHLTRRLRSGALEPTVGRADAVASVLGAVLQRQPRLAIVRGERGAGKTNLLHAVARRLDRVRPEIAVVRVDLARAFAGSLFDADREHVLAALLDAARGGRLLLCLERIDLVRRAAPHGPLQILAALESGVRLVATAPAKCNEAAIGLPADAGRVSFVDLFEPPAPDALAMVRSHRDAIAAHHGVEIDDGVVGAAVERARGLLGHLPGKAVALLDAAGARAALDNQGAAGVVHVFAAANDFSERADEAP